MEGFESCLNPSGYLQARSQEGYTSKRRGGGNVVIDGLRVLHVNVVYGADLPPCVLVEWLDPQRPKHQSYSTRQFESEQELEAWLKQYGVQLSRHPRRL